MVRPTLFRFWQLDLALTIKAVVSAGSQFAVMPPSMTNSLPVIQAVSSDAKYRHPNAMSDGLP
jgi:hypothetical protein